MSKIHGKSILVLVSARFELARVQVIGIRLYSPMVLLIKLCNNIYCSSLDHWCSHSKTTYFLSFTLTILWSWDALESSSSDDECFLFREDPFDESPTVFTTLLVVLCSMKKQPQKKNSTLSRNEVASWMHQCLAYVSVRSLLVVSIDLVHTGWCQHNASWKQVLRYCINKKCYL